MLFLGWLVSGLGVFLMYVAYRGLSPVCVATNVIQGKSGDCKQQ